MHPNTIDFGKLYSWGAAHNGELGTGKRLREMRPVSVEMEQKFIYVQAGYEFSLALAENGVILVELDLSF
jgi:alpha-tubulin suppressor-like RCC1 family protein